MVSLDKPVFLDNSPINIAETPLTMEYTPPFILTPKHTKRAIQPAKAGSKKMKNVGMKAGIGGALGITGLALCCALPGLGIATAAGVGAGLGLWTESILGGILVGALVLLGVVAYKRVKAKRRNAFDREGAAIACDPTVFSKEE